MTGKSGLIRSLKRHFWAQKFDLDRWYWVHGKIYELTYGEDFGVKDGDLGPENSYFPSIFPDISIS